MTIRELAVIITNKTGRKNPDGIEGNIYMWLESYLGDALYNLDIENEDISACAERIEKDIIS